MVNDRQTILSTEAWLRNYDGTQGSEKAYAIMDTLIYLKETTIPALMSQDESTFMEGDKTKRLKALKEYERKLLFDLGKELGNDNAWENL